MKKVFLVCLFMATIAMNAQTTFQKGNFVTKANQQTECLIKNYDWNKIPTEIEYKPEESGEVKKVYASQLKSFYIDGTSHMYREYDVPVIKREKGNLVIKPGLQLLKVIAEGKASLLKNNDDVYFLHFEGQPLKPLIYERFINTATGREETDNSFRLELYNSLKCESVGDLRKVKYTENQLINIINEYNDCQDSQTVNYADKKTKSDFNVKVVAGVSSYTTSIDMMFEVDGYYEVFNEKATIKGDPGTNFTAGFEAELRLPFNHKKWALFVVPTYNKQKGLKQDFINVVYQKAFISGNYNYTFRYGGNVTLSDFSYIEIPVGLRHYFILSENSELSIDASYGASIFLGKKPEVVFKKAPDTSTLSETVESKFSIIRIGAGYSYQKYSIGINYYARKAFGQSYSNGAISVLLGYKIL